MTTAPKKQKWNQGNAPERIRQLVEGKAKSAHLLPFEVKSFSQDGNGKKSFDPEKPLVIEGFANAAILDRTEEIMPKECWDLVNFLKNPVILSGHNSWQNSHAIGKALSIEPTDKGLRLVAEIGDPSLGYELTDEQKTNRSLIAQGVLKAFSVGFIPHVWEYDEETETLTYKRVELLEVSVVSIPCQPDSLIETAKRNSGYTLDVPKVEPKAIPSTTQSGKGAKAMDEELKKELADVKAKLEAVSADVAAVKVMCEKWDKETASEGEGEEGMSEEEGKALKSENALLKAENVELTKAVEDLTADLAAD